MAKKTKSEAKQIKPVEADTVTYSTRFDEKQRQLIEEGAAVLNWSPAKLIREAAVRRAADVVNAAGRAETQLRVLAAEVARWLHDPLCTGEFTERVAVASQIRYAMETSGTRFLELVLQEWEARASGESGYKPKVSADELLKGNG